MTHVNHGIEIAVDDGNGVTFRALCTSNDPEAKTASGFALVDTGENGFGWPKGVTQFFENFVMLPNGHYGSK